MFRYATHIGTEIDRHVHGVAHVYSRAVQPGLRALGVDTSRLDRELKGGYDLYNQYASLLNDGATVVDGIARNLRGGTYRYP